MATMSIRLPDGKHERLRRLAERSGVSLNKLVDEYLRVRREWRGPVWLGFEQRSCLAEV